MFGLTSLSSTSSPLVGKNDVKTAALQLRLNPAVEFAEPNFLIKPDEGRGELGAERSPWSQVRSPQPSAIGALTPSHPASSFGQYNPNPGASFSNSPNSPMVPVVPQVPGAKPDDPRFNEQWALSNTGQSRGQYGSDIGGDHGLANHYRLASNRHRATAASTLPIPTS